MARKGQRVKVAQEGGREIYYGVWRSVGPDGGQGLHHEGGGRKAGARQSVAETTERNGRVEVMSSAPPLSPSSRQPTPCYSALKRLSRRCAYAREGRPATRFGIPLRAGTALKFVGATCLRQHRAMRGTVRASAAGAEAACSNRPAAAESGRRYDGSDLREGEERW